VDKYLISNRCQFHYKVYRNKINKEKNNNRINTTQDRKITILSNEELKLWFDDRIAILVSNNDPRCMECRQPISTKYLKAAVAHIFPKAIFDSVKTHKWNYLFLGSGCGCHNKSHRLDTFSKMKVWPLAVNRFKLFRPYITEKHKYLNSFIEYANLQF
jgi:hypothetical protein